MSFVFFSWSNVLHNLSGDRWALGFTKSATLYALAEALLSKKVQGKLPIFTAVNPDDGPSSGLWLKSENSKKANYIALLSPARTFIAIIPKI